MRTGSWRKMHIRICIIVIGEIPFTKVWRSQSLKLQYELLVNKRISCRSVAPGLKKNLDGWPGSPSDWFRPGATYRQLQANARLAAWVERCCIKKNSDLLSTMVLFFFTQMWHNYISNVLLAQNDKGSLDIIKHLIVYIV